MNAALLRHAIDNIWCNPGQDRQHVYKLVNLSPRYSVRNHITLFYERIPLPTQGEYYHVYQLGKVLPKNLGLPQRLQSWMALNDLAEYHFLFTDVYTVSGIQFPRFQSHVWITPNRNLVIAVKENRRIDMLYDKDLYIRFYSNAFFNSVRSEGRRHLLVRGMVVDTNNNLVAFQRSIKDLVDLYGGYPYYFVNGRFCHNISLVTAGVDDIVEFVLDGSIKRQVEFTIQDQPTFVSSLDDTPKYILHYDDPEVTTIEYLDDVDAFMLNPTVSNRFLGVTYHRNHPYWMRMLTHKDYAVPVARFKEFVEVHPVDSRHQLDPVKYPLDHWDSVAGKKLRLYIRDSGYERPLVANANRIKELYRLPSERIIKAFRGIDSVVDIWRAENLEKSPYINFMSIRPEDIYPVTFNRVLKNSTEKQALQEIVGDAYGYHAAATILSDTPSRVYGLGAHRYADLSPEHHRNTTLFEYDADGLLLGYHHHLAGSYHLVDHPSAVLVEAVSGKGSKRAISHVGTDNVDLTPGYNFRVYVKSIQNNTPTGDWLDITDADDRHEWGFWDYLTTPKRWVWTKDPMTFHGLVREDVSFLCYDLTLILDDGHLRFTLERETQNDAGDWGSITVTLPYGQLDIFLNGRSLAEGIDYTVHWPEVVIHNKEYLRLDEPQSLVIRNFGFPSTGTQRLPSTDVNFVTHGVLSHNQTYDIHSNKITRVVCDGGYHHPDDVVFDEQLSNFVIEGVRNGAPYFIQTPPVIFQDVYENDIVARAVDDVRNQAVEDYMTDYFDFKEYDTPDYIERKYQIISPFSNKLLTDIVSGVFYPDGIEKHYGGVQIRQWCKDYEWLLPYDPCNTEYDKLHLNIRPHWGDDPVELDMFQYQFYYRVLETYLRYPPNLSPYITIKR
jgi:hypothetical protein